MEFAPGALALFHREQQEAYPSVDAQLHILLRPGANRGFSFSDQDNRLVGESDPISGSFDGAGFRSAVGLAGLLVSLLSFSFFFSRPWFSIGHDALLTRLLTSFAHPRIVVDRCQYVCYKNTNEPEALHDSRDRQGGGCSSGDSAVLDRIWQNLSSRRPADGR